MKASALARPIWPVLGLVFAAAGCTPGAEHPARGAVRPTVEGGSGPAAFADLETARAAFTRHDGPLTAILEDAAWIRYEPDPGTAEERHAAYFEGRTAFQVTTVTKAFLRPTEETYVLEDSNGVRLTARPTTYKGEILKFGPARFLSTFTLEFSHALTKDVKWVRLLRDAPEGGRVEWGF